MFNTCSPRSITQGFNVDSRCGMKGFCRVIEIKLFRTQSQDKIILQGLLIRILNKKELCIFVNYIKLVLIIICVLISFVLVSMLVLLCRPFLNRRAAKTSHINTLPDECFEECPLLIRWYGYLVMS